MKKLLQIAGVLILLISNFAFAQTGGCTPTFPMLPKPLKDKILVNYDNSINKFSQDNSKQQAIIQYLEEFNNALTSGKEPTADDYKKLEELKTAAAGNETVRWINETAAQSETFDIFLSQIGRKIESTQNVEELNILVITSYQLQIVNSEYKNNTNKVAKCSGWWSCWGKCAAGITGGAITGGLAGAAVAGIPTLGIGAVPGAIVGAIGGGLSGAAAAC